jgi:SAM-dependent MidA family methyltransferase
MTTSLPLPSPDALAHSQALTQLLLDRMREGSLSFSDFMQACLYEPGLGYYAAGNTKFGEAGDFITAPMITPLFGHTLAQAVYPCIQAVQGAYLELGAGNGQLARDILDWMIGKNDLTTPYYILEVSPDCRAQQQALLADHKDRVQWLDTLPTKFRGVILANEVLDALPVDLFHYQAGQLFERRVGARDQQFIWVEKPIQDDLLRNAVEAIDLPAFLREDYLSEINPTLTPYIHSLIECVEAGKLLFIDYGFLRSSYYHPDRNRGTLICHYRHHAHPDPFFYPGLQDITAHVDFTTVGLAAQAAGAEVALYTQAEFLLAQGLLSLYEKARQGLNIRQETQLSQAVQKLLQPQEMGELFKVMEIKVL